MNTRIVPAVALLCSAWLTCAADKLPDSLFMKESPEKASNVGDLKKTAKEGDEIVLRAQIGGQPKDVFSSSRASMMVADMSLKSCDKIPGDTCKTPWDFCCVEAKEKAAGLAIVQVVDEKGKQVKATLKGANSLDHLRVVVVKGKVSKNDGKNLIVNATGIYVEPAEAKPADAAKPAEPAKK